MEKNSYESRKVVSAAALKHIVSQLRAEGKILVWTNGCFDILHSGHVIYLEEAKRKGDILIVGLNSDASVRALKGDSRPVIDQASRARVLSALECVDYVTIFDSLNPLSLIEELRPDVYVKGGDYSIDTIDQDERRAVEAYGGRVVIVPAAASLSTTAIIRKICDESQ